MDRLVLLDIGGYEWLDWRLRPDYFLVPLLIEGAYLYAIAHLRSRVPDAGRIRSSQLVTFSLGVVVIYLATGSTLDVLADEYLLSAHVLEAMLLMFVAAPLLVAGIPGWLPAIALRSRGLSPIARLVAHPVMALAIFNGVFLFTHLPSIYGYSLEEGVANEAFHFWIHGLWVAAGMALWWPILSNSPDLPRLSYPLQMGYLFVQSILPAVFASVVTFSDGVVYDFYTQTPRLWGISPNTDQQIAGGTMKLLGSFILWAFIVVAFFRWYAREEAAARQPAWPEAERELEVMGLARRDER